MLNISDNIYNKTKLRSEKKFKLWTSAGLMLTYKCSAACRFCYYNCTPTKKSPLMPVKTAINTWQQLKDLAGTHAKLHITGGEPFLYYDHLIDILTQAKKLKLGQIDQIETNAYWATDKNIVTEWIKQLDSLGMNILKISCDPFHTEFINPDKINLLAQIASDILGEYRVLIRWDQYLDSPSPEPDNIIEQFKLSYQKFPFRFTGRAAFTLARHFADKTLETISALNCQKAFRDPKGIHIDPHGNIFSGVCSGMILGNVNKTPLDQLWQSLDWQNTEFFSDLFNSGPASLLPQARKLGYHPKPKYAGKCHLCTDLRQFFFDIDRYNKIIGPIQCYTDFNSDFNVEKTEFADNE